MFRITLLSVVITCTKAKASLLFPMILMNSNFWMCCACTQHFSLNFSVEIRSSGAALVNVNPSASWPETIFQSLFRFRDPAGNGTLSAKVLKLNLLQLSKPHGNWIGNLRNYH